MTMWLTKKPGEITVRLPRRWELVIDRVSIGWLCVYITKDLGGDSADDPYLGFHFGQRQKHMGKWQWGYQDWFYNQSNHTFGLGPFGMFIWSFE